MLKKIKDFVLKPEYFNGFCLVLSALIIAVALILHARTGRYQFTSNYPQVLYITDTWTGKIRHPK